MEIEKLSSNILDVESDALVFSTNTKLALTGGVGLALVDRFGPHIQTSLINASSGSGMELAELGDVIVLNHCSLPWSTILFATCSDGSYVTSASVVKQCLHKALAYCDSKAVVSTVSFSYFGTGYGTLSEAEFLNIFNGLVSENQYSGITKVFLCNSQVGRGHA